MDAYKYILTVFTSLLVIGLSGQERFNRIYSYGDYSPELIVLDSGYATLHQQYLDWNRLIIREYDLSGDVIDSTNYLFDEFVQNNGGCSYQTPDKQNFIFAMSSSSYARLIKFDRNWDTVKTRKYLFTNSHQVSIFDLLPEGDSSFVLTGYDYDTVTTKTSLLIARFDTALNLLWENHYEDTRSVAGGFWGFNIIEINEGYLLGGRSFYPGGQYPNNGIIAKADRNGDFDWFKQIASNENSGALKIAERSDSLFIYAGAQEIDTSLIGFVDPSRLRFGIFNEKGTIILDTLIGPIMDEFGTGAFFSDDGSFIIGGPTITSLGINSHLFKFSENGDSIWQRFYYYGYPEAESWFNFMQSTPDSGFVMAGIFFDVQNRYNNNPLISNWLLKVDQYGCVAAGCEQIGLVEGRTAGKAFQLYPKPARGVLSISGSPESHTTLQVELYSLQGQKLWQQPVELPVRLRLPDLPGATYLLLLKAEGQVVQRERLQILR